MATRVKSLVNLQKAIKIDGKNVVLPCYSRNGPFYSPSIACRSSISCSNNVLNYD